MITLPLAYGIYFSLINKIIYDFTLYHIYIPFLIENIVREISDQIKNGISLEIIFLISCFSIELIMILIFLEIIELNFCGLNKNLKKYIKLRALIESSLEIEDDYDVGEVDNERNSINNERKEMNLVNHQ